MDTPRKLKPYWERSSARYRTRSPQKRAGTRCTSYRRTELDRVSEVDRLVGAVYGRRTDHAWRSKPEHEKRYADLSALFPPFSELVKAFAAKRGNG